MAYVYRHIRLDKNEVFYIGVGGLDEFDDYKRAYWKYRKNPIWNKIVNKTKYEVEIIFDKLTKKEALEKESEFIKLYGRRDLNLGSLCNFTDGGEGGINKIISEDRRKELSKIYSGKGNPFYGKKHKPGTLINNCKLVLNLETGIYYDSMREAYTLTKHKYKAFKAMLNGQTRNKTSFVQV